MTLLTDIQRKLLVEVAFAGVNHGLRRQVRAMLPALPYLVPDKKMHSVCLAILLAGLGEPVKAEQILQQENIPDSEKINTLFINGGK